MRSKLLVSFVVLMLGLLAVASIGVEAAPGGNGNGKGGGGGGGGKGGGKPGGTTYTATLVVSPDPVLVYGSFDITGCGYHVEQDVGVLFILTTDAGMAMWSALIDSEGCIVDASGYAPAAGSATLEARQYFGGTTNIMASTDFTIE